MKKGQISLGAVLVRRAFRCWDLTAAVPKEHEDALWAEGDQYMDQAALFGDETAVREVTVREQRRVELAQLQLSL